MKIKKVDTIRVNVYDSTGTIFKLKEDNIQKIKKKFNMFLNEKYL